MSKWYHKISAIGLVCAMVLSMGACGGSSSSESGEEGSASTTETSSEGKEVVTFFHRWPNEPKNSLLNDAIAEFEAANPDIDVQADCVLNDSYKEKIRILVSGNDVPDVFCTWSDSFITNLVGSGNVKAVDDLLAEDPEWAESFVQSQLPPFQVDGKQYALPLCMDGKAFFYNKEAFEKAGCTVPTTYAELLDCFEKLKAAGYETPVTEGLADPWAVSHWQGSILQRYIDPAVLASDMNLETMSLTDDAYIQMLDTFKELAGYMGEAASAMTHEDARNMFISGEVPVLFAQLAEIRIINGEASTGAAGEGAQFEFGFFNFPSIEGGKGDQTGIQGAPEGWCLSADASDAAVKFYKFLLSKDFGAKYTQVTGEMSAIQGAVTEETANAEMMEAFDTINSASSIIPWFDNAFEASIADAFMRGGQSLAIGDMTSEEVMETVRATAEEVKNS